MNGLNTQARKRLLLSFLKYVQYIYLSMKRKVPLTVNIPHPCTQSFNEMSPAKGGRFCLHCQKTVIDFSGMTDKEILVTISKHSGNLCGNFQPEQLNRALIPNAQPRHSFLPAAMLASLIATIIPGNSKANDPRPAMEQIAADHVSTEHAPRLFKGQIVDSLTNEGLHGVTIALKGSSTVGAVSDAAGKFQLTIPSGSTTLIFRISYMGYTTKEISFNTEQLSAPVTISLQQSVIDLKDFVVTGYAATTGMIQISNAVTVTRTVALPNLPNLNRLTWWERIVHLFREKEKCSQ